MEIQQNQNLISQLEPCFIHVRRQQRGARIVTQHVKPLLVMPVSHIRMPGQFVSLHFQCNSLLMCLGSRERLPKYLSGPLPPRVGEQDGIAAPGFSLAQDAEAVWGVNQQMEDSHIHSLSVSQIKLNESFKQERNKCYRR